MRIKRSLISQKELASELLNYYKQFVENEQPGVAEENLASWLIELNFENLVDACILLRDEYHYWSLDTAAGKQKLYRVIPDSSLAYSIHQRIKELDNHTLIKERQDQIRKTPSFDKEENKPINLLPYINLSLLLNKSLVPIDILKMGHLMKEDWFIRDVKIINGVYYLPPYRVFKELSLGDIKKHLYQEVESLREEDVRKWQENSIYK